MDSNAPMPQRGLSPWSKPLLFSWVIVFVVFMYTFLHEGGHALVGVLSGAAITAFSLSVFDLGAHVAMTGNLTPAQTIANNLAGVSLPLLVWLGFMLAAPRRANLALESLKVAGTLVALNTLLAWAVLPLLVWAGQAPSDDAVNFLHNSGVPPLWVTGAALLAYLGGWLLFGTRIAGWRQELDLFRAGDRPVWTAGVRRTTLGLLGVLAVCGFVAFAANGFRLTAPRPDPFLPPPGYAQVATIDLSAAAHDRSVVHTFTIEQSTAVGVYLLVEEINSEYFDVVLTGPNRYERLIIRAEGYTARRDNPHIEETLAPGQYQVVLTSKLSPGVLSVFARVPP